MAKAKQPSRKNKVNWRKNIDLEKVEQNLERKRAAERVGEDAINRSTESSSIFIEDRKGDEGGAAAAGRGSLHGGSSKKTLKSLDILRNNSGASSLTSRARKGVFPTNDGKKKTTSATTGLTPEQRAIRAGMTKKDIEKLRRAAGRDVKGAFGIVVEEGEEAPTKRGLEAVIEPSTYDVWTQSQAAGAKGKHKREDVGADDGEGWNETNMSKTIQLPASFVDATKKSKGRLLSLPDPGQSYNPAAEAHEALLNRAMENAKAEEDRRQKELEWKKAWDRGAKEARGKGIDEIEDRLGLKVGQGEADSNDESGNDDDDEDMGSELEAETKEIKRKTKQQKAKAKKLKEENRARLALKASKRSMSEIQSLKSLKKQLLAMEKEKTEAAERRQVARQKRLDERVGVYKVPRKDEDVQLEEDLAEGLRLLKPEGNLLQDRSYSFHKHGIIEPKKRDTLSKRKRGSMRNRKEYETHAYKRFS